jgi:hypothetical protein
MAKALRWGAMGAAIGFALYIAFGYGVTYAESNYQRQMEKAHHLCSKPKYSTSFVSYANGSWHCFNRHGKYPFRVTHTVLVTKE